MKPSEALSFGSVVFGLLIAFQTEAAVFWNESVDGDLSNSQSAPTSFTLSSGANSLIGTAGSSTSDNRDWIHLNIPAGFQLSAITPASFVSTDSTAFIGVQAGTTFVGDSQTASPYLGYTHISAATVGVNVLPSMGTAFGASGFTPPLPAGDYVFLIQQLGTSLSYQIDYTVAPVPEPRSQMAVGLALSGIFFVLNRARRQRG